MAHPDMWKEKWWGWATWKNGLAFLWLRGTAFEERKKMGRSTGSAECAWGGQGGRLELKRPHPCFSRCPFCNLPLFFLEEKRQQIQSFRKISDKKREKPDLGCAFINCFTAVIAIGTSVYNAFSITVSPTRSFPLVLFPITLLLFIILYNVSNPLLGLLAKFRLLLQDICLK